MRAFTPHCHQTARASTSLCAACRQPGQAPAAHARCLPVCQSLSNGAVVSSPAEQQRGVPLLELEPAQAQLRLFDTIPEAVADIAAGKLVVVLDNEDRENEGDLIMAGQHATQQALAFMVEHTTGIVCAAMPPEDLDRLELPLMVPSHENDEAMRTAFTVTVDGRHTTSTGVSASDRCSTILGLADPAAQPEDFNRPGHIFPLRARKGGVRTRPGHTEAGVDLCLLAGCQPVGVLSEVVDRRTGQMARTPQLLEFARQHGLRCITIADLVRYLDAHPQLLVPQRH